MNSLQIKPSVKVSVGDRLLVLAWVSHRERPFNLQRMATTVFTAEADDGSAVPQWSRPFSAGVLFVQPAGAVVASFPPRLHQALHCAAGPAGTHRQSCVAALGSSARSDTGLLVADGS